MASVDLSPKHVAMFQRLQQECGKLPDDRMEDAANIRVGLIKRFVPLASQYCERVGERAHKIFQSCSAVSMSTWLVLRVT